MNLLKFKTGDSSTSPDSILADGELLYDTTLNVIIIGNGTDTISVLKENGKFYYNAFTLLNTLPVLDYETAIYYYGYTFSIDTSNHEITIKSCSSVLSTITIPAYISYKGTQYTVTKISGNAFGSCPNLVTISIPDTITTIDDNPFYNCTNLTTIKVSPYNSFFKVIEGCLINKNSHVLVAGINASTIPSDLSLTKIGDHAFSNNANITGTLVIPNGITSLGVGAFNGTNLSSISTLPNTVVEIKDAAFANCQALNTATIPSTVTSLGGRLFEGCTGLITCTIWANITTIGQSIFKDCSALNEITIPFLGPSKTGVGNSTDGYAHLGFSFNTNTATGFYQVKQHINSNSSTQTYYIPTSLTKVTISGGYAYYGAFESCTTLTTINTRNINMKSYNDYLFSGCTSLTNVTLPTNTSLLSYLSSYFFKGCTSLTNLNALAGTSISFYGAGCFSGCTGLTTAKLLTGTSISTSFAGCTALTEVELPKTMTNIADKVFSDCCSLQKLTVPFIGSTPNTSYGQGTLLGKWFGKTSATTTDKYNYTTQTYKTSSTGTSTSTTSNYIPKSLATIIITGCADTTQYKYSFRSYALNAITSIQEVKILASCPDTILPEKLLYGCTGLVSIYLPRTITSIGARAVANCTNLSLIAFAGSQTEWTNISKASTWDENAGAYTVVWTAIY